MRTASTSSEARPRTAPREPGLHDPELHDAVRRHRRIRRVTALAPVALGVLVLLVWEALSRTGGVDPFFLPAPSAIAARLAAQLVDGGLLGYTTLTLVEALLGCAAGAAVALPLGWLVARNRWVAAATQPYIAASQALPAIALAPLLALWLGYGLVPIVVLCAITVFFPILLGAVLGLRTLDQEVVDAARLDGAAGWTMVRWVELPLAAPSILTGLRNGFTLSVTGAVVGEFVVGGEGLGMLVSVQARNADTTGVFATLTVLAALAVAMYALLRAAERLAGPDRPTTRSVFAPPAGGPR